MIAFLWLASSAMDGWVHAATAQPLAPPPDETVEVFFGTGSLGSYATDGVLPVFPWLHAGAVIWLNDRVGVAVRHARGARLEFSNEVSFGLRPHRYSHSGSRTSHFSTVTTRYRVVLDTGVSLTFGIGAQFNGSTETRLLRREIWVPIESLDEADRRALRPLGQIDERMRRPWGKELALEMLFGRRLSEHVGIASGLLLQGNWRREVKAEAVVLVSFWR